MGFGFTGGRRTFDGYPARSEPLLPHTQHAPVICRHDGYDGHAGLHGQVERSLFESPQFRSIGVAPRALGEDEDALPLLPHLRRRLVKRCVRGRRVRAVDEDGARERHEPAEKGHEAQGALGRHAAVGGKDGPEEEDIELGLMVPDQHARSRL